MLLDAENFAERCSVCEKEHDKALQWTGTALLKS